MNAILKDIYTDLREKPLLGLGAVALIIALIAVPLLVAKSSKPGPSGPAPSVAVPPAPGLPVVSAQTAATGTHPTGHSRDPFTQGATTTTTPATSTSTTSSTASSTSSHSSTGSSSGSSSSGGATLPISSSTPPTQIIVPPATPKPVPAALNSTQTYEVSLAITNSAGGLDTIDPLERLSVLPNDHTPLLVELGVLKGGHRVLFAVQPGAVLNGPGRCTPGPIDCEILSLGTDQTEGLAQRGSNGTSSPVALFAVTSIATDDHSSAAATKQVRRRESAAGRAVLNSSPLSALSLFRYDPSQGVVLDLRNLTVGG